MTRWTHLVLVFALLTPVAARGQNVHVVDSGGGGDFNFISQAVSAASAGDLVLVRAGTYIDAMLIDKPITIVGDGVVTVRLFEFFGPVPIISIEDLTPSETVVIRGLRLDVDSGDPLTAVSIVDCEGTILFEDCRIDPTINGFGLGTGMAILRSDSVTLRNTIVDSGFGLFGAHAMVVLDSTVFLHDSVVRGNDGSNSGVLGPGQIAAPGGAGNGLSAAGASTIFATGTTFRGGNGGSDFEDHCFAGEDGGDAVLLNSGPNGVPVVRAQDVTLVAGNGGIGGCGMASGSNGTTMVVNAGAWIPVAGVSREFSTNAPVAVGETLSLVFDGEPGDFVSLLLSASLAPGLYLGGKQVALHLGAPFALIPLVPLPGSGTLQIDVPFDDLDPLLDFATLPFQGLFDDLAGRLVLSGPSVAVFTQDP